MTSVAESCVFVNGRGLVNDLCCCGCEIGSLPYRRCCGATLAFASEFAPQARGGLYRRASKVWFLRLLNNAPVKVWLLRSKAVAVIERFLRLENNAPGCSRLTRFLPQSTVALRRRQASLECTHVNRTARRTCGVSVGVTRLTTLHLERPRASWSLLESGAPRSASDMVRRAW